MDISYLIEVFLLGMITATVIIIIAYIIHKKKETKPPYKKYTGDTSKGN